MSNPLPVFDPNTEDEETHRSQTVAAPQATIKPRRFSDWLSAAAPAVVWAAAAVLVLILALSINFLTPTTGDPGQPSVTPVGPAGLPDAAPANPAWASYSNSAYGFSFRYPHSWSLSESKNFIRLSPGPSSTEVLTIGFRSSTEEADILSATRPAGDRVAFGTVPFLGQQVSRHELMKGGKVKAVLYNLQSEISIGGSLVFSLQLDDPISAEAELNLPPEVQTTADGIISSFQISSQAVSPGDPEPSPAAVSGRMALLKVDSGISQVYVMNADGSGLRRVSDGQADAFWPALSPDGEKVAFAVQYAGNREIVVADLRTGGITNLTNNPAQDDHPLWSPDGREIAFQSDRLGSPDLFMMDARGADPQPLLATTARELLAGRSANGEQILFFSEPGPDETSWGPALKSLNLSSGQVRTLIEPRALAGRTAASLSPDGRRLAYETILEGQQLILVINLYGAQPGRVERITGQLPVWSPDGRQLAYATLEDRFFVPAVMNLASGSISTFPNLQGQITSWVAVGPLPALPAVPIEGPQSPPKPEAGALGRLAYIQGGNVWTKYLPNGGEHQLTQEGGYREPRWSPSARWLAYRGPDGRIWNHDLERSSSLALETQGPLGAFAWAPAADQLAYVSSNQELRIYNPETGETRVRIPEQYGRQILGLSWSPDGQWIAFEWTGPEPGTQGLWKVPTGEGEPVALYPRAGKIAGWTSEGKFLLFWQGVSPENPALEGAPLALLPAVGGEAAVIRNAVLPYPDFVRPAPPGYGSVAVVVGGGRQTWARKALSLVISQPVGQLAPPESAAIFPVWSPQADRLAYSAMPDALLQPYEGEDGAAQMQRKLWVVHIETAEALQLTADPLYRDEYPQWSADGSTLLFVRLDLQGQVSLWTIPAEGGPARQVLTGLSMADLGASSESIYYGHIEWYDIFDWAR